MKIHLLFKKLFSSSSKKYIIKKLTIEEKLSLFPEDLRKMARAYYTDNRKFLNEISKHGWQDITEFNRINNIIFIREHQQPQKEKQNINKKTNKQIFKANEIITEATRRGYVFSNALNIYLTKEPDDTQQNKKTMVAFAIDLSATDKQREVRLKEFDKRFDSKLRNTVDWLDKQGLTVLSFGLIGPKGA